MADILKGISSAGGSFLFAWVFPSAIALALLQATVLRRLGLDVTLGIAALSPTEQALVLGVSASALGLVMSALSTPLYRFLEGYAWPLKAVRDWGTARQRRARDDLKARAKAATGIDRQLLNEQVFRFPADDNQTAPTRLGNALRAFETYGSNRYGLDSQSFWSELVAVAPDSLREEQGTARASVDFFVAAWYLSLVVGIVETATALAVRGGPDLGLLVVGLAGIVALPFWYRWAVTSSSYWDSTVRALVNLGRIPLAKSLGLELPGNIEDERRMWYLAVVFRFYAYDTKWAGQLNEFRTGGSLPAAPEPDPAPSDARLEDHVDDGQQQEQQDEA
jgi:hypothetical protein